MKAKDHPAFLSQVKPEKPKPKRRQLQSRVGASNSKLSKSVEKAPVTSKNSNSPISFKAFFKRQHEKNSPEYEPVLSS